jgi:nucleoside-diphosphate-sugar epimerase
VSDVPEGFITSGQKLDMRVFVAGGTGAIGRHLIPALIADGEFAVTNELRTRGTDYMLEASHRIVEANGQPRGRQPGARWTVTGTARA